MEDKHLGIYIHIPFSAAKCSYCDFYSMAGRDRHMPAYQEALLGHIEEASGVMAPYYIDTVYFGGGTPSYYGSRRLVEIFDTVKRAGKVLKKAEVTVECNPDSVTYRDMTHLLDEGVNRISLGVQSVRDDLLKIIGRRHNFAQAQQAVKAIRSAGCKNLSVDVIYGLPTQSRADWADTLGRIIDLEPDHISCYGLKLEKGTPMYYKYGGSGVLPDDDEQADMYLFAVQLLQQNGFTQYEISNFARRGKESRHNLKYWTLQDYLGFGPGAHSSIGSTRYSYVRSLHAYITGLDGGNDILDQYEELSPLDRSAEYIMLGLRCARGISEQEYTGIYRCDFTPMEKLLREFEGHGWAVFRGGRWSFTSSGFLLSNTLIGALLEAQATCRLTGNPWLEGSFTLDETKIVLPTGGDVY